MGKGSKKRRKERRMKEKFNVPMTIDTAKESSKDAKNNASKPLIYKPKRCHKLTEIYNNLWIGALADANKMAYFCDILVPLDSLDGYIWDIFEGEIHYWPITDMSVLPDKILERAVNDILNCLNQGKKVGIFCLGGHGRTGYFVSCILGKLGIQDPIELLRKEYCEQAVETYSQAKAIGKFIGNDELADKHFSALEALYDYQWGGYGGYGYGYGMNWTQYYKDFGSAFERNPFKEIQEELEEEKDLQNEVSEDFDSVNKFLLEN